LATIKKEMKHIIYTLMFFSLISNSFSQTIEDDTLNNAGAIRSSWGMKFEVGGLFHQMPNQDIVDNKFVLAGSISLFYKQLFIRTELYTFEFSPKNSMVIGDYIFFNNAEFISININPEIGYSFNINNNWSSDIRLGVNITNFDLSNSEDLGSFSSDFFTGVILGGTLDRYIKFQGFKYLVIGLNIDYYSTNYGTISPDLNKSSWNFSITAAYKFWFKNKYTEKTN
jgi:hypothetical protein